MVLPRGLTALLTKVSDVYIVIAIVVLSVILTLSFLIVFKSLLNKKGTNKIFGLPISFFLMGSLGIILILSAASTHPVVCSSCHVMRPSVDDWRISSHRKIKCISCHKKSSIMALPVQKFEQAKMVVSYLSDDYKLPILANASSDACLDCHGRIERGVQVRFKIMMSHREVIQARIPCTECHEDVAHSRKSAKRNTSLMEKCSGCHNDEEASARCETCHMDDVWLGMKPSANWGIEHGENWSKTHGGRSLYTCKNCHYEKDCTECHSMVPHPEGWPYIHGKEAKNNPDDCYICHKEASYCRSCHLVSMPHPVGWMTIHKWEVEVSGKKVCSSCHSSEDCQNCHDQHSDIKSMGKK